jgi:hypothetical protein
MVILLFITVDTIVDKAYLIIDYTPRIALAPPAPGACHFDVDQAYKQRNSFI